MGVDKYTKGTLEMIELIDKGLSAQDARTLVKPHIKGGRDADYKLMQKHKQWALTHPKRVQKASKVYDNALAGRLLTKNSEQLPSNTQVLAVAREILDRQEPKVTVNQNLNVSIDLTPVDLDKYRL
jgi:hypothetical protein